ncbi:MAG: AgmX/PglI C-terminal domain-containing protein [Deltaproteobacteria bacterium]|nr:AgmX/PglI C-terminal domain-containing protein [Deltaproteobacteria bacterium]
MDSTVYRSICFSLGVILFLFASNSQAGEGLIEVRQGLLSKALSNIPADAVRERCLAPYFFVSGGEDGVDRLPLRGVESEVNIAGVIAEVRLIQTYENSGKKTLEAVYLFPASTRAAVHAMRMTVGERVIEARIQKRAEARETYDKAKQAGQTASLLEQQRPNVFQMSVANILPGDKIRVELVYSELLVPEDGLYEFVLPTVVGPRYSDQPASKAKDSERWVENPYLKAGEEASNDWGLKLALHAGMPISKVSSPSHQVDVEFEGEQSASVELRADRKAGNRDFVLRYRLAGESIQHGMLLYEGEKENYFLLMAQPPARTEKSDLVAREYLFILDVSGSMNGYPLDTSKAVIRELLRDLRSYDYFNVLLFAGGSAVFSEKPMAATRTNVRRALDFVESARGGGGTNLLPALKQALSMPRAPKVARSVVLLTDGYVAVEREAFELIRNRRADSNLFAFGIGSSVNRFLIEGLARAGLGEPFVVSGPDEAEAKAKRFRNYISSPVLTNIKVGFEGFEAYDVEPLHVPDLFAQRPVILFGKWKGKAEGQIRISGLSVNGQTDLDLEVNKVDVSPANKVLGFLWARHRIQELDDLAQFGEDADIKKEVTRLGLAHGLLTRHTSFVAVDPRVRTDGNDAIKVLQPLALPQGVSNQAVGGRISGAGVLGVLGTRGRGGGVGYGSGFAGLGTRRPQIVRSRAMRVTGTLDKNVIRRVIRLRLRTHPKLSGKIVVKLVIGPKGFVKKAEIKSSTMNDKTFETSLLKLLKTLRFPKPPGGGELVINYPFVFKPSG